MFILFFSVLFSHGRGDCRKLDFQVEKLSSELSETKENLEKEQQTVADLRHQLVDNREQIADEKRARFRAEAQVADRDKLFRQLVECRQWLMLCLAKTWHLTVQDIKLRKLVPLVLGFCRKSDDTITAEYATMKRVCVLLEQCATLVSETEASGDIPFCHRWLSRLTVIIDH